MLERTTSIAIVDLDDGSELFLLARRGPNALAGAEVDAGTIALLSVATKTRTRLRVTTRSLLELDVHDNELRDLPPLDAMTVLRELRLEGRQCKDIARTMGESMNWVSSRVTLLGLPAFE